MDKSVLVHLMLVNHVFAVLKLPYTVIKYSYNMHGAIIRRLILPSKINS